MGLHDDSYELASRTREYIDQNLGQQTYLVAESDRIIGEALLQLGKNDEALEALQKAEAAYPDSARAEKAECYNSLGVTYWNNGNIELANTYHNQSLEIRKELYGPASVAVGDSYNNLGLLYLEEDGLEATLYFNRSLRIYQKVFGDIHPKVAFNYINLARAKSQQGLYSEAEELLDKVLAIWNSLYETDHPNVAFTLNTLSRIKYQQSEYDEALSLNIKALKIYLRVYGLKHPEIANTHFLLGSNYQQKGEFKLALQHYQDAIYANLPTQDYQSLYDLPGLDDYFNGDYLLSFLLAKAKILEALHFEKSLRPKDLKASIETYQKADTLVSLLRRTRFNESDKIRLAATSRLIYKNGIELSSLLFDQPFLGWLHDDLLYSFFERSKASVLLESIQESDAKSFAGIPSEVLEEEDSLLTEISYLNQKKASGPLNPEEEEKLFTYQLTYKDFVAALEENYPEYYELKYSSNLASLEDVQNALSVNQEVWMYFLSGDTLHHMLIGKKSVDYEMKVLPVDFYKNLSAFRNALRYRITESIQEIGKELCGVLVPARSKGSEVIIIPDAELSTIPFETLIDANTNRFLIEDKSISYDFSCSLAFQKTTNREALEESIFLLAPVDFESHSKPLASLPGTEEEVSEIKYLFVSKGKKVQEFVRTRANEEAITLNPVNYRYIHFATHGVVNSNRPELSCIYTQPSEGNDGILYVGEIYNLKMQADLVSLSACETGLGKLAKGEGIIGLSRALTYSGARNQLVSYWTVSDASTSKLMAEFYKHHLGLSEERPFSRSLRHAKLELIKSEEYKDPYYWAAFVLIGQ
jgi:tetratricopeptide (TPR) repeat protein